MKILRDPADIERLARVETHEPTAPAPAIRATPFVWRPPAQIPRRRFVYGRHYARRFVSATVGSGAVGKSSFLIAEALAIVTGRALLGVVPQERGRAWLWNGEDPREEIEWRVAAAWRW